MKSKKYLITVVILVLVGLGLTQAILTVETSSVKKPQIESISTRQVGQTIVADGTIHSENETTLHFQTGGKVVYLPFKIGDKVTQGQTIAQLDTYALQRELSQALNTYLVARSTFDQANQNAQNNVLQSQQAVNFAGIQGDKNAAINSAVQSIVNQNQNTLNNSVINVELANDALQLASLTAPFSGVITAEDITSANVNVTPLTSFSLADPSSLVFRANVAAEDVDFVQVGSVANLTLNGSSETIRGTVERIYPEQTVISGQSVFQVDITSPDLQSVARLGQNGAVTIQSSADQHTVLVPTWTVLGHAYLWVMEKGKPILKKVSVGKSHGESTEILNGLTSGDAVIVGSQSVAAQSYTL